MYKIVFDGWEVGMRKISFIKLLHEEAGIPLAESKRLKDKLVNDNETIEVLVEDGKIAKDILEKAVNLKVKGHIQMDIDYNNTDIN